MKDKMSKAQGVRLKLQTPTALLQSFAPVAQSHKDGQLACIAVIEKQLLELERAIVLTGKGAFEAGDIRRSLLLLRLRTQQIVTGKNRREAAMRASVISNQ